MGQVDVCERIQVVSSLGYALSRRGSSQIHVANGDSECEELVRVESGVQIIVVVGKHYWESRMRVVDWREIKESRRAAIFKVDGGGRGKRRRGRERFGVY